jgi:hypothetical protein
MRSSCIIVAIIHEARMSATFVSEHAAYEVILTPTGDGEYSRQLREAVVGALRDGERRVVIDCRDWLQLDLRVLSSLVRCARACIDLGAAFELINLRDHLRADLHELRLDARLGLHI